MDPVKAEKKRRLKALQERDWVKLYDDGEQARLDGRQAKLEVNA